MTRSRRATLWVSAGFIALAILHQDVWWWDDGRAVFGFLPIGLAWHVGFSLAASGLWLAAALTLWPEEPTEPEADLEDEGGSA